MDITFGGHPSSLAGLKLPLPSGSMSTHSSRSWSGMSSQLPSSLLSHYLGLCPAERQLTGLTPLHCGPLLFSAPGIDTHQVLDISELLGASLSLVGHAVPSPYPVILPFLCFSHHDHCNHFFADLSALSLSSPPISSVHLPERSSKILFHPVTCSES